MIYFDNAATGGRKPDAVLSAVKGAITLCANPGRSGHKLSLSCAQTVQNCREILSNFFDGYGFERTIFTKNCSEALNLAIFGLLKKGDHVVTTTLEHNSVLRPLEILRERGIITYDVCPLVNGEISPKQILRLIKPRTRMVALTSASNVTGKSVPVYEITKLLPENVLVLCDGAQGGGHLPISMKKWRIDALALAGHKGLMGIQGSGALLLSERCDVQPLLYGGTGSTSFSLSMPDFLPDRLEVGTLSFPAICSLYEGVRYLTTDGKKSNEKTFDLTKYLCEKLHANPHYKLYSTPNPCGIVAFSNRNLQSEITSHLLSDVYSIAVRGGLHCAPLAHKALGTGDNGLVRVSFSHFNTYAEIDELLVALDKIAVASAEGII